MNTSAEAALQHSSHRLTSSVMISNTAAGLLPPWPMLVQQPQPLQRSKIGGMMLPDLSHVLQNECSLICVWPHRKSSFKQHQPKVVPPALRGDRRAAARQGMRHDECCPKHRGHAVAKNSFSHDTVAGHASVSNTPHHKMRSQAMILHSRYAQIGTGCCPSHRWCALPIGQFTLNHWLLASGTNWVCKPFPAKLSVPNMACQAPQSLCNLFTATLAVTATHHWL